MDFCVIAILGFLLYKAEPEIWEVKLLKEVPLKLIECKNGTNIFFFSISTLRKKWGQFLDKFQHSTGRGGET